MSRMIFLVVAAAVLVVPGGVRAPAATSPISLAFASNRDGDWNIYTLDEAGGQHRLTTDPGFDIGPSFSPDGKRIAFASNRAGTWDLWSMNADGSDQRRLTQAKTSEFDPVYSPTGKWIAFETNARGNWDVAIIPAGGGTPVDVSHSAADDFDAGWAPDGSRVAYDSGRSGDYDLYETQVPRGKPGPVLRSSLPEFHPSYAADGNRVAFDRNVRGDYNVFVLDRKAGTTRPVTSSREEDSTPAWGPGDSIAFVSSRDGDYELYLTDASGQRAVNLTKTPLADDVDAAWRPGAKAPTVRTLQRSMRPLVSCTITGTGGVDSSATGFIGSTGADTMCALEGNDIVDGMENNDKLYGDPGTDRLYGRDGADTLYGGTASGVSSYGGTGHDRLYGVAQNDDLRAKGDAARDCAFGGTGLGDIGYLDKSGGTADNHGIGWWSTTARCGVPYAVPPAGGLQAADIEALP